MTSTGSLTEARGLSAGNRTRTAAGIPGSRTARDSAPTDPFGADLLSGGGNTRGAMPGGTGTAGKASGRANTPRRRGRPKKAPQRPQNEGDWKSTGVDRCLRYAEDVLAGRIRTGKKVRMACERFLDDLEKSRTDPEYPWVFDEHKAGRPIDFMERFLVPTKGDYDRMELMGWQCFIEANLYGWVRSEEHTSELQSPS